MDKVISCNHTNSNSFALLAQGVYAALETYSNVHRGSGHFSMVTTALYEKARDIVLEYLHLDNSKHVVIFCTPRRKMILLSQLKTKDSQSVCSLELGLPIGIAALAVRRKALRGRDPDYVGGGMARLVATDWVVWEKAPARFEAGTPPIIHVIAFARALKMILHSGNNPFRYEGAEKLTALEILYHDALDRYAGRELLENLRKNLISSGEPVPTLEGSRYHINLDNAASTPTFSPIWDTVCQVWHQAGEVQQKVIQQVRSVCADMLGAPQELYDIIFTSNTTESINLVAESLGNESIKGIKPVILDTILEHNSNDLPWRRVHHHSLIRLTVDGDGFIDLNQLDSVLSGFNEKGLFGNKRIRLVAVSGASNVLGVFNDLKKISHIVHRYGALLLVDAAQMVAHRKVSMLECGIDYLAFSAHKVYAPFGTGVLVARKGILNFTSSDWELIRSSGEENSVGIAALGKALVLLQRVGLDTIQEEEQALTRRALIGLSRINGLTVYGIKDPESSEFSQKGGVIVFEIKGMIASRVARALAERGGIGVRYGCHCAHMLIKHLLHVPSALEKLQRLMVTLVPNLNLPGLTRISFGIENTTEDVDNLLQVLKDIALKQKVLDRSELKKQMDSFVKLIEERVYSRF